MFPAEGTTNTKSRVPEVRAFLMCVRSRQRLVWPECSGGQERVQEARVEPCWRLWVFILSAVGALPSVNVTVENRPGTRIRGREMVRGPSKLFKGETGGLEQGHRELGRCQRSQLLDMF